MASAVVSSSGAGSSVRTPKAYQPRIIAFIDVLGWSYLVEKSVDSTDEFNKLSRAASQLAWLSAASEWQRRFFREHGNGDNLTLDVTHFSDILLISCPLDSPAVHSVISHVQLICQALLLEGLYTRGAITTGLLYHADNVAFGPALIEAYGLESRVS